jgi:hypothetical protein
MTLPGSTILDAGVDGMWVSREKEDCMYVWGIRCYMYQRKSSFLTYSRSIALYHYSFITQTIYKHEA